MPNRKRPAQAGGCRVNLRGRANQPKSGHLSLVGKQDRQGRQACLGGQDRGGRGQETVGNPALDLSPLDLHLGEEAFGGNEKVRTIGEDRKEEGESKAVTEVGGDP